MAMPSALTLMVTEAPAAGAGTGSAVDDFAAAFWAAGAATEAKGARKDEAMGDTDAVFTAEIGWTDPSDRTTCWLQVFPSASAAPEVKNRPPYILHF